MNSKRYVSAVIVCAGNSIRMGGKISKVLLPLRSRPAIYYTLKAFEDTDEISEVVVVARECDIPAFSDIVRENGFKKVRSVVKGGECRSESVLCGVCAASESTTHIAVHDGARCLISPGEIKKVVYSAFLTGAATLGTPVNDTVKRVDEASVIKENVDRSTLRAVQTPQVFLLSKYRRALEKAESLGEDITDDCMIMEKAGYSVTVTEGSYENIKLTTKADLIFAEAILASRGETV